MNKLNEQKIINSWKNNVQPWILAIRKDEIESRLLVTNEAIVNVILEQMVNSKKVCKIYYIEAPKC